MTLRAMTAITLATLTWLAGCNQDSGMHQEHAMPAPSRTAQSRETLGPLPHSISYYRLLAKPEEYDGQPIQVFGILGISDDGSIASLYPNMESFRYKVTVDSLEIHFTDDQSRRFAPLSLDGKFVLMEGIFARIANTDEDVVAVGTIKPVIRVIDFSDYYR